MTNRHKNQIGLIGLNDSSVCLLRNLTRNCFSVATYDVNKQNYVELKNEGFSCYESINEFNSHFVGQKIIIINGIWNHEISKIFSELLLLLEPESIIIDATDSKDNLVVANYEKALRKNIDYVDAAVIGTLNDITWGFSLILSGNQTVVRLLQSILIKTLRNEFAFLNANEIGSAHFIKMVHDSLANTMINGLSESLELLHSYKNDLNIKRILNLFEPSSLVSSRILSLMNQTNVREAKKEMLLKDEELNLNNLKQFLEYSICHQIKVPTNSAANLTTLKIYNSNNDFKKITFKNIIDEIKKVKEDD